jgi:hypothetical protein
MSIYQKLSENAADLKKFLSGNFPGFDNLTDKQIQKFYNRYYLDLDSDDSVIVFSRKPLSKSQVIKLLLQKLYDKLNVSSIEEVQVFADQTLDSYVKVLPNEEPEEAPVQDIEGEGEFDDESNVSDSEEAIEEESDDYDMDDMTWVEGETDLSQLSLIGDQVPGAAQKAKEYMGGFTPVALGDNKNPEESYQKFLNEA